MRRDDLTVDALVAISSPFGVLALTPEALQEALARGRALVPVERPATAATASPERLVDAEELGRLTAIPASWWSDQARQGAVPVRWFGRYPRFIPSECINHPRFRERER